MNLSSPHDIRRERAEEHVPLSPADTPNMVRDRRPNGEGSSGESSTHQSHRRLGAMLVVVVAMLYVGSGIAIQLLFDELDFDKPFFFSYLSVMLCSTYLSSFGVLSCRLRCRAARRRGGGLWSCCPRGRNHSTIGYSGLLIPELLADESAAAAGAEGTLTLANHPRRLLRTAAMLAPAYFALNYTYFLSLDLSSVSETMVLSASTGVWTLLFSRLVLREPMSRVKYATVVLSMAGICIVISSGAHAEPDASSSSSSSGSFVLGDRLAGKLLAIMSAASSGIYMVLLRACVPDETAVHMPSLFGLLGLTAACAFAPLFPLLHLTGIERFELPRSNAAWGATLINAVLSTVLPDMLLAQAVVMTSPLLATLGLSMMIPFSIVADYVMGVGSLSVGFFVGG